MNLRDSILGAPDRASELVDIPEWGGITVLVRELSCGDRERVTSLYVDAQEGNSPKQSVTALVAARALHDPATNKRIFSDGDAEALEEKSFEVLDRICQIANRLSSMEETSVDDAEGKS